MQELNTHTRQSSEQSDLIAVAFDVFDQNKDGLIGPAELNSGKSSSKPIYIYDQ